MKKFLAVIILLSIIVLACFLIKYNISSKQAEAYDWSPSDQFDESCYVEIEKTPGKDFVILNLADIQLSSSQIGTEIADNTFALIDQAIKDQKPDLITLSGDNAIGTEAYLETVKFIDSYGIPWAAVMGNHDGEGCTSEDWAAEQLAGAKNSLFRLGPKEMGHGNYVINITENGKIIHSLYMMDTHSRREYDNLGSGYDHLWDNQIEWYEWAVKGNNKLAGKTVQSTIIAHIPVPEYYEAWHSVAINIDEENGVLGEIDPAYSTIASGVRGENECPPPVSNGFFDKVKELGSTKDILVGHDHVNDYSIVYDGIRLSYSLKTGFGSYYSESLQGATTITVSSSGATTVTNHYYALTNGKWTEQ